MAGKTARACDGCLLKRARWYCLADDAFLCQACDSSVHSANQLASRHHRVRLETSSFKPKPASLLNSATPSWHQGLKRKARTPRHYQKSHQKLELTASTHHIGPLVPEIGSEEGSIVEEDDGEHLLCRVPVFDPFDVEIPSVEPETSNNIVANDNSFIEELARDGLDNLSRFLGSDADLVDFAADVESLLGEGVLDEDGPCGIKDLASFFGCKEENGNNEEKINVEVKDEELEGGFDWNFDYESPSLLAGDGEKAVAVETTVVKSEDDDGLVERKSNTVLLRLNYEEVITAWASQGCPWTTGIRPEINLGNHWPDSTGTSPNGRRGWEIGGRGGGDGDREARVSRYREKRRTRLFSKKIRYEVRKLNAEKRPRMKGRFVKRASFSGTNTAFPYSINK